MAGSSSSSSSSPATLNPWVYLSFCDEDTGKGFTSHLKHGLSKKGIDSFTHEDEALINDSRCSVIIFSLNYASSPSRLDEIVKIIDGKETKGLFVIPVFYGVDPTDVRKQTGNFGEAFAKHGEDFRAQRWKEALVKVTDIAGKHSLNRNEAEFISEIVELVSSKMSTVLSSNILKSFFGMSSHASRLNSYFSPPLRSFALLLSSFFFVP